MENQFYLDEALELSPEQSAFRVGGGMQGVWEVRLGSGDKPYTLIHYFINPPGAADQQLQPEVRTFRTIDELLAEEARQNAWFSDNDWYPLNDEVRRRFKLPR